MGHFLFSGFCQKINACGNDGEGETTRKETESSRALKSRVEGTQREGGSLNNGKLDERRAFSLRKFCNC